MIAVNLLAPVIAGAIFVQIGFPYMATTTLTKPFTRETQLGINLHDADCGCTWPSLVWICRPVL